MGTSTSFGQFSQRIGMRVKKFTNNTEKVVRRSVIAGSNVAISTTPVDTGRAKGNWIAAIGTPHTDTVDVVGSSAGNSAQAQNQSTISRWKLGGGSIYLNNNLPYILPLDNGSSEQAPNGMSTAALEAMKTELRKARLLK